MIDEYEDPSGGPPGGPKGSKMAKIDPWGCNSEAILGSLGPPAGPPRGPNPRLSFSTTPPHKISVRIMKICRQSELLGAK